MTATNEEELRKKLGLIEVPYEERTDLSTEIRDTYLSDDNIEEIVQLIQAYGNQREEDALRTIWAFGSDSMLELRQSAGQRVAELTKLKDTNGGQS